MADLQVRVVNGRWARTSDCGWIFIVYTRNAVKKLKVRQGDGFCRSKEMIMSEFGLAEDVNLTFQWPEWMDVIGSAAWKRTCPVTIKNDEAMEVFFAMRVMTDEFPLYISEWSVEQSVDSIALQILEENAMEEEDNDDFNYWQQYAEGDAACATSSEHEVTRGFIGGGLEQYRQSSGEASIVNSTIAAPTFDDQCEEGLAGIQIAEDIVEYEGDEIFVGRVFINKHDCRVKLAVHAFRRRFQFRHDRSYKKLTTLTCTSDSCPWRVYIVKVKDSDNYHIKSANLRHSCSFDDCSLYRKQATAKFIRRLRKSKFAGAIDFQKLILDNHDATVSYWKAWNSHEPDSSFALLPSYLYCLCQAYPGSVTHLHLEAKKFKYLFLAFSFSLSGIACMRRVIILDAAPLCGSFAGCLLNASYQDPNFQEFPLAFAIVDGENDDAWEWFFHMLKTIVPDSDELAFVSKWHSPIYTSLRRVYPKASHGACVAHLHREVCTTFQNHHLADLVSEAACAYRVDEFHAAFIEIGRIEPECAEYLEEIGFCHWTRSHFMGNRYNIMTCNVAQSVSASLKEARDFPIISLLEFIRTTLITWFAMRREATKVERSPLPPKIRERICQNLKISEGFTAQRVDALEYEVKGDSKRRSFHVHLGRKSCTCREYNLVGIPCSHALCAAVAEGYAIHELVGREYNTRG